MKRRSWSLEVVLEGEAPEELLGLPLDGVFEAPLEGQGKARVWLQENGKGYETKEDN